MEMLRAYFKPSFFFNFFQKTIDKHGIPCYNYYRKKEREVITMTRTEIIERIDKLETNAFYLDMKDRWTQDDYRTMNEWRREIRELKKKLETA